jgi:hypothetical protein
VKRGNDIRQVAHQLRAELSCVGEVVKQVALRETAHFEHPIDDGAIIENKIAVCSTSDGACAKINGRSGSSIELELRLGELFA